MNPCKIKINTLRKCNIKSREFAIVIEIRDLFMQVNFFDDEIFAIRVSRLNIVIAIIREICIYLSM